MNCIHCGVSFVPKETWQYTCPQCMFKRVYNDAMKKPNHSNVATWLRDDARVIKHKHTKRSRPSFFT